MHFGDGRLSHDGKPLGSTFGATSPGACSLYVRPRDILITAAQAGQVVGTIVNIRRTAAGRRAQIVVGSSQRMVEAEIDLAMDLPAGASVGLTFVKGRVFSESDTARDDAAAASSG